MNTAEVLVEKMLFSAMKIDIFLGKRDYKVTEIEMATTLYQDIGNKISRTVHATINNHDYGCIIQFFNFHQKILVDSIFNNFIAVIGGYDTKKNILKSWERIPFSDENEKNSIVNHLKSIRQRYAIARNNNICHINDDDEMLNTSGISTAQIIDDVKSLRNIFNQVRTNNDLPPVISMYQRNESYPVKGCHKIIEILNACKIDGDSA